LTDVALGRTIIDKQAAPNDNTTFTGLVPDTQYSVFARAINRSVIVTDYENITTATAIDATARINGVDINENGFVFDVSDLLITKTNNDYNFDRAYYTVTADNTSLMCQRATYAEFKAACTNMAYNKQYQFKVDYDTSCKYHYDDVAPATKEISTGIYNYDATITKTGNVSILKVNNMDVPASVSTFVLDTSLITLNCSVNSRFDTYNKLSIYVDGVFDCSITGDFTKGINNISTLLTSSVNDRNVTVKVSDIYGDDYMESNTV